MCTISVVIPTHNSMPYIKEVVRTLSRQTYKDFEIIFVDDGSKDGTLSYLEEITKAYSFASFFRNPVRGAGGSRNLGLSKAKGTYVVFLDSDDVFAPDLLKTLYYAISQNRADIAICEFETFSDGKTDYNLAKSFKDLPSLIYTKDLTIECLMLFEAAPWNKLIRKELLDSYGIQFQNCKHANDVYGIYSAIFASERIAIVKKPLVRYRTNRATSLQGQKSKNPTEVLTPFIQLIKNPEIDYDQASLLYKAFLMHFRSHFNNLGSVASAGILWDALRDSDDLVLWLKKHQQQTRVWEDALIYFVLKMPFDDYCDMAKSSLRFFQLLLPEKYNKYSLLFTMVIRYCARGLFKKIS